MCMYVCEDILPYMLCRVRESGERKGEGHGEESAGEGRDEEDGELKRQLELAGSELKELRERKSSLERECVIYQSQLEVRPLTPD